MPVEIGTYDQVKAILENGEYQIGSKKQHIFQSVEEIVVLKIKKSTSAKQKYTMNDLKELESKVVLIRDHSTKEQTEGVLTTENQSSIFSDKLASKDIEKFLNVSYKFISYPVYLCNLTKVHIFPDTSSCYPYC